MLSFSKSQLRVCDIVESLVEMYTDLRRFIDSFEVLSTDDKKLKHNAEIKDGETIVIYKPDAGHVLNDNI